MPNLSTLQGQTALDVETLRRDFPILARRVHDRPLVYLDSAASSQKPLQVLDAVRHYYQTSHANIHRGVYVLSEEATIAYEQAHERVAHFIHADWEEVIFTKNTTEALNLVAYAWGLQHLREGDEVVLTQLEHHSNIVPWQQIARRTGAVVRYIRIDAQGRLDMEHAATLIGPRTKMVSVAHVSNVLGTVNPVAELGNMAHAQGALLCVDGAQSIPHMAIDVRALDCDFFAFSGHKMLGPTGIGGLYGKRRILEQMEPFLYGGDMISEVTFEGASWNDLPWKFEAGTPPIAQGIGLAAAVEYLEGLGMEAVQAHEHLLVSYALEQLRQGLISSCTGQRPRRAVVWSLLTSRTCIRTMWPRFWTNVVWPFGLDTTVPCPSWVSSVSMARAVRAFISTIQSMKSMCCWRPSGKRGGCDGDEF